MDKGITYFFADDNELWRKTIVAELELMNILCTGQADNGSSLMSLLSKAQPDVVLLDLSMPVMDGNRAMERIRNEYPALKVIVLSMHYEDELIDDYMARGACGYLSKGDTTVDALARAIETVAAGQIYIRKQQIRRQKYSRRQIEMISLICDGLTNKEIANIIGISERGVEKQRSKIYQRVGAKKAVDFYKFAFRQGLDFLSRAAYIKTPESF